MRGRRATLPLGVISEGTLNSGELLTAFLLALNALRLRKGDRKRVAAIRALAHPDAEQADWVFEAVEILARILEEYVPDYCYFGAPPGETACFGVWPDWDRIRDDPDDIHRSGVYPDEEASDGESHWLHVNDHGNATLYRRVAAGRGHRWVECWSIV